LIRRPQQARQTGTAGQGNAGAGAQRGGNREPLQPANIPVSKSKFSSPRN